MREQMEKRAIKAKMILLTIHSLLQELDEADPYGDIVQNFQDYDRVNITERLIHLLDQDLARGYWSG